MQALTIIRELETSVKAIEEQKITDMIQQIKAHRRIFVYGTGRSGLMRFMQIGLEYYVFG